MVDKIQRKKTPTNKSLYDRDPSKSWDEHEDS